MFFIAQLRIKEETKPEDLVYQIKVEKIAKKALKQWKLKCEEYKNTPHTDEEIYAELFFKSQQKENYIVVNELNRSPNSSSNDNCNFDIIKSSA